MESNTDIDAKRFDRTFFNSKHQISYLGEGSFGGKAMGLAQAEVIINKHIDSQDFPEIDIRIPRMLVLRTSIFDLFMNRNKLYEPALSDLPDNKISLKFQEAELPFEIVGDLRTFISNIHEPLAIRSSSLLEDAMNHPFAGIFGTKMTPNNQPDIDSRFNKLVEAIKFVYASTYFKDVKEYIKATPYKIENEKMAIILQEVVGNKHDTKYYPELSGVARSYNFYPVGHATNEEGVVNLALGLGKTIVDGGTSWSYAPTYPQINPPFGSITDMLKYTQLDFWAINMGKPSEYNPVKETEYLTKGSLMDAETDGVLKDLVSTYDSGSDRVWPGLGGKGPRILTFEPILKMNAIPLNNLLIKLLNVCESFLGAAVEIEFALTKDHKRNRYNFGFLQLRPMIVSREEVTINKEGLLDKRALLASESVLGNGEIATITDVVYVDPERFQLRSTNQIAEEIGKINAILLEEKRSYILIGFGRWGTSDPTGGIPVKWGQVSGAKVIVETTLENVYVEMSQGSHFFHNVTGFKVFYFSIPYATQFTVDWDWLEVQPLVDEYNFIKHIRLNNPFHIKVDGRSGRGIIIKPEEHE